MSKKKSISKMTYSIRRKIKYITDLLLSKGGNDMQMPSLEQMIQFGEVLIEWGFYISLYGVATMAIGAIAVVLFKQQVTSAVKYIMQDFK